MIRTLLTRRVFWLLDVIIALWIAYVAYQAVRETFLDREKPAGIAEARMNEETAEDVVASLGPRSKYEGIISSGIFGPAARSNKNEAPPEPVEVKEEEQETQLPLTLIGTSAALTPIPLATAIIRNNENQTEDTYYIGQEIIPQVTLLEVYPREVLLMNGRLNQKEYLRQNDTETGAPAPPAGRTAKRRQEKAETPQARTVNIKREEVMQEVFENYEQLTKVKAELYHDEDGNVAGVTAENLDDFPMAKKLGFRSGDVIQTINNEMIDSENKIMELLQKYQEADSVQIGILRGGRPQTITFKLQ